MSNLRPRESIAEVRRILLHHEKKEKASLSLSGEIVKAADALAGKSGRSAFVERAVRAYLRSLVRRARDAHDLEAINSKSDATNRESDRVLDLQAWPE